MSKEKTEQKPPSFSLTWKIYEGTDETIENRFSVCVIHLTKQQAEQFQKQILENQEKAKKWDEHIQLLQKVDPKAIDAIREENYKLKETKDVYVKSFHITNDKANNLIIENNKLKEENNKLGSELQELGHQLKILKGEK